jgi:hypothetical protein
MPKEKWHFIYKIFLRLFVFLSFTQLTYHFSFSWSKILGIGVDYLMPAIYLNDLVFLPLFVLFLKTNGKAFLTFLISKKRPLLAILFFVLVNAVFSQVPANSLIKWGRASYLFLFALIIKGDKELNFRKDIFEPLGLSVLTTALVAVLQFANNGSLGGFLYWIGERRINVFTPGAAKMFFFGGEQLRPYSTFSHPNSAAGFIAVATFILLLDKKLKKAGKHLILVFGFLGGAVFFSKNFFLSYTLLTFIFFFLNKTRISKKTLKILFAMAFSFSFLLMIFSEKTGFERFGKSAKERLELLTASREILIENPIFGTGLNNFYYYLPKTSINIETSWKLQPVHNVYILYFVETGMVGSFIIYFIYQVFTDKSKFKRIELLFVFGSIALTGLFDHYWLTSNQNLTILFLTMGLFGRKNL